MGFTPGGGAGGGSGAQKTVYTITGDGSTEFTFNHGANNPASMSLIDQKGNAVLTTVNYNNTTGVITVKYADRAKPGAGIEHQLIVIS